MLLFKCEGFFFGMRLVLRWCMVEGLGVWEEGG